MIKELLVTIATGILLCFFLFLLVGLFEHRLHVVEDSVGIHECICTCPSEPMTDRQRNILKRYSRELWVSWP